LWKNIRKGWGKLSSSTRFEVGDDSKISFGMTSGLGKRL